MWWIFLLLIIVSLLAPLIWAMFRVSKLRFADARGQVIAPEQVPTEVLLRLKNQVDPLVGLGFEYLGMRSEERGGHSYWQVFLSSAGGMVWAVAEENDQGKGRRVSLLSFGSNGQVAITRDGDEAFGEEEPEALRCQKSFGSALEQAEAHAALLTDEMVPVAALDPESFLNRYERLGTQSLDALFEKGWLQETSGSYLKVSVGRLPVAALAWVRHQRQLRKRKKEGTSWLLESNVAADIETGSEREEQLAESTLSNSHAPKELDSAMPVTALTEEELPESLGESAVLEELADLGEEEMASLAGQIQALPVGPIDKVVEEAVSEQGEEKPALEVAEEIEAEDSIRIPEEDGLARDLALYQKQASQKSWSYWLAGFGGRALFFVSILLFALWMVVNGTWGLGIVCLGISALLAHEAGHALVMLARRSWDWSFFVFPVPHPMSAQRWQVKGGWGEFVTILAGPLPGLVFGWVILFRAYLGQPVSDLMLDAALAAVVVNSVTLLPFLPLDGGRLLDLAFLRRIPQLRGFGLVVTGLAFCVLAFLWKSPIAGTLGLLMWFGIPAARRKSKLLPWFRANSKEESDERVTTAYAIVREHSRRKSFNGVFGIARLDEFMGLGQAKPLGVAGGIIALFILALTALAPLAIPAVGLARNGQDWFEAQSQAEGLALEYLGPLRPVKESENSEKAKEMREDAFWNLESWQTGLSAQLGQPQKVFADDEILNEVRTMNWRLAAHWISDSPQERQIVAREAALALRREAMVAADNGEGMQSFRDLSVALRIIIECEPRSSLDSWVSWLELEREILKEVEDVSSRYALADTYSKWFEGALSQCPRPNGKKFAGLILAESEGYDSLLSEVWSGSVFKSGSEEEGGVGRRFLSKLQRIGEVVSAEPLQKRIQLAQAISSASTLKDIATAAKSLDELTPSLEESFSRVENNSAFRQIALSGLKVKRLGMDGARTELAKLREDFGYQARVDTMGERESLKLSRLTPAGEVVEMEWLLQQ